MQVRERKGDGEDAHSLDDSIIWDRNRTRDVILTTADELRSLISEQDNRHAVCNCRHITYDQNRLTDLILSANKFQVPVVEASISITLKIQGLGVPTTCSFHHL